MDSQSKGKTWAGSIYQKFEAICLEVDDIVSKDTVKFVGNQVQTVGVGVKKFCSDVVQDLLPPVDPVKCNSHLMTKKKNDKIGTYIRSITGINQKSLCATDEESAREQNVADLSENCISSMSCEPDQERQFLLPLGANPSEEAETDIALQCNENSEIGTEKNVAWEEQPVAQAISSSEDRSFSESSLNSTNYSHIDSIPLEVSSPTSVHDSGFSSPQEDRTIRSSSSDETESSELLFLNISCENEVTGSNITSSGDTIFTERANLSESPHANLTQNAENICCNYPDTVARDSNISSFSYSGSLPTLASENEDDMLSTMSSSLFSSVSNDAQRNDGSLFVVGSNESMYKQCSESTQLKTVISSSEIGRMDESNENLPDPSMETIDLSETKPNESCDVVDNRLLFALSSRPKRFKSYKKILEDAFASRKRLIKEYEQLAIWYGDIDAEASQHFESPSSPPATSIHLLKPRKHETWESDWEFL